MRVGLGCEGRPLGLPFSLKHRFARLDGSLPRAPREPAASRETG